MKKKIVSIMLLCIVIFTSVAQATNVHDTDLPIISNVAINDNWVTIIATDDTSSVTHYKMNDGNWQASNGFNLGDNTTASFYARDSFGNVSEPYRYPNNVEIDTEKPTATYSLSTTEPTNGDVEISVNATDNVAIKSITLPNGDIVNSDSATFKVSTNSMNKFIEMDTANNKFELDVPVTNIDKVKPIITDVINTQNADIEILEVIASDDVSSTLKYSFDGGETWQDSNKLVDAGHAKHQIIVVDFVGNESETFSYTVKKLIAETD